MSILGQSVNRELEADNKSIYTCNLNNNVVINKRMIGMEATADDSFKRKGDKKYHFHEAVNVTKRPDTKTNVTELE